VLEGGRFPVLEKPFTQGELGEAVRDALGRGSARVAQALRPR
jgi:hypothetical protein